MVKNELKRRVKALLNSKELYFCLFFTFVNYIIGRQAFKDNSIGGFKFVLLISLIVEVVLILILKKYRNLSIEKLFLLFYIPIGIAYIVLLPCGQSPDDYTHFARIYGITEGVFVVPSEGELANGGEMPVGAIKSFSINPGKGNYQKTKNHLFGEKSTDKEYFGYPASALYNPLCYIPQTLGVIIGKLFSASVLIMAYLGRIFNFAVFVVILYFSIKLIPSYKEFLLFIALLPITFQEATSLSPDALSIGLSVFIISFVLYLLFARKKIKLTKQEFGILYASAIIIGFCKIVYLPILALYFVIPKECFGGKKKKIIHAILMIFILLTVNLIWLVISSKYLIQIREGVNSSEQVLFVFHHPFTYLETIMVTIEKMIPFYLETGLGVYLGPLSIKTSNLYFFISIAFITLILAQNLNNLPITVLLRLTSIGIVLIIVVLIFTSLYVQWTPVGSDMIDGIQGRYFLPIVSLVPIIIGGAQKRRKQSQQLFIPNQYIFLYGLFFNIAALTTTLAANI